MERSDEEPSDSQKTPEEQIRDFAYPKRALVWDTELVMLLFRTPVKWDTELVILLYILSVSLDPLLLYSLILNDDRKCVVADTKLEKIAIVLRSLADLSYIWSIIRDLRDIGGILDIIAMLLLHPEGLRSIPIAILGALPVPQVAILVFFPRLRASTAVNRMRIMNSLILLQYVPRIYPIYRHCKNLNKNKLDNYISTLELQAWVPGLFNFILYILASHVFGAFWYFFSIQRQIACWGHACQSGNGCEFHIFDCDDGTFRNVTLLNDLCPINPSNAKVFDFGIYLDALQSGMLGSTNFPQKVLQCFSWGVRNLSSFGSNLKTSMNASENAFVVLISIIGLLLFIYLLGHLQTFMQATNKEYWIWPKIRKIELDIERMSNEYGLSNNEGDIRKIVRRQLQREEDLAVENIFSILPSEVQDIIKRHLLLPKLKEVPTLQGMDQKVLNAILKDLEQVMYDGGNCIIREGEPLAMMIFISRGRVFTCNTTSTGHGGGGSGLSNTIGPWLTGGDFYGEELISWAATSTSFSDLPISNKTLKSHEKVEVFALRVSALLRIVSKHKEAELGIYLSKAQNIRNLFPSKHTSATQLPHPTDNTRIEINEHGNS